MLLKLIVYIVLICATIEGKPKFNIGIVLPAANDELEIAFRSAVDRSNINERSLELEPVVMYANIDDSFIMEKTVCNLISEDVIAIFGPTQAEGSDIIASICHTLDIPHITFDWSPSEALDEKPFRSMSLNLHPDNLLFAQGIAEIVQNFGWRSFTLVYESEKELQQLQNVLQIGEPSSNPTTIIQLPDDSDYRPFLKAIKTSTDNCMILHCSLDKLMDVLRQAKDLNMLGEYQSIFIPLLDMHTLDALQEMYTVGANITTIRLMDPTDYQVKNLVRDWKEREKREGNYYHVDPGQVKTQMILISDAVAMFVKGLSELEIIEEMRAPEVACRRNRAWPFGRRIIEFIKARSDEVFTGRIDFNQYGQRSFFTLRCMEITPTGLLDLSTWDPVNKFTLLGADDASDRRVGEKIQNKTFIVTSRLGAPFLAEKVAKDGEILEGNARYEGYSLDLIDAMAKLLNFKYEFRLTPDGKYGGFNPKTQQWDGLVRQLLDGNADLGICDLTMTSTRRKAVDFTPPFMTLGISILYMKPEVQPPNLFSFLLPFSKDVWVYMATGYLGVSLLFFVVARMAPEDWENPHPCKEPEEYENAWTIANATWLTIGSIMGQGCDILPKASSTRLITAIWWFFALMMLNSYTANLAAFLTMSRMGSSIKSAEDLAAQNKIKYGAVYGASTMNFFKESNFTTYQRMWAVMESDVSVFTKSNDEGVERVLKGKRLYAYLMESTVLEYIVERKCELTQIGGWLDYKTYGIAMPFNSPYRKQISGAVLKLGEAGTLTELKRKWWKEMHGGGKCAEGEAGSSDTAELDIESVGGVFLVLGIGLVCGLIIGMVEFLWNVKSVAVDEKLSYTEALKVETIFALKFWESTKPVHGSSEDSSKSSGSSSSASSSSSTSTSHSKSAKSIGLSVSHSMKSLKSSIHETVRSSVHEKLKKFSSMFSLKSLKSEKIDTEIEAALAPPILPRPLPIISKIPDVAKQSKGTQFELKDKELALEAEVTDQGDHQPHHFQHHHHRHHRHQHQRHEAEAEAETEETNTNDMERAMDNRHGHHKEHKRDSKISSKIHMNDV